MPVDKKTTTKPLKKKASPDIELEPKLATPEDKRVISEATRPTTQVDYMINLGLGDRSKLNFYRKAIQDPRGSVRNPQYREYVGEVLETLLDLIWQDNQMYTRLRSLLQKNKGLSRVAEEALEQKALDSGLDFAVLLEVYLRGFEAADNDPIQAFGRVNSFIARGRAWDLDLDLQEQKPALPSKIEPPISPSEQMSFARIRAAMKRNP